jgi:hypothetical protein
MYRVVFILGVVLISASVSLAVEFPTLTTVSGTIVQTTGEIHASSSFPPYFYAAGTANVPSELGNDYTISSTLDWINTSTSLALVARGNLSTNKFYEASINPNNRYFALTRIDGLGGSGFDSVNLDTYEFPSSGSGAFDVNKNDYRMALTVNGSNLSASIYDGTTLIKTLTGTDTTYTSGQIAVHTLPSALGGATDAKFLNPTISTVPEPGTATLAILGILALLGWAGSRSRR